jgi:hypothetical protein
MTRRKEFDVIRVHAQALVRDVVQELQPLACEEAGTGVCFGPERDDERLRPPELCPEA